MVNSPLTFNSCQGCSLIQHQRADGLQVVQPAPQFGLFLMDRERSDFCCLLGALSQHRAVLADRDMFAASCNQPGQPYPIFREESIPDQNDTRATASPRSIPSCGEAAFGL